MMLKNTKGTNGNLIFLTVNGALWTWALGGCGLPIGPMALCTFPTHISIERNEDRTIPWTISIRNQTLDGQKTS